MATQPNRSFAARKQAQPTTKASDKPAKPAFQIETTTDVGPFKAGQFLTKEAHIAEYFRLGLNFERKPEEQTILSDDQIIAGVKHVDVTGMNATDAETARIAYLEELAQHVVLSDDSVPVVVGSGIGIRDEWSKLAASMGEKADEKVLSAITKAVEGKRDWASAPIFLERELERVEGVEGMLQFPPYGTRRQGLKSDTVPAGMTAEQWRNANSPVEYYLTDRNDPKSKARFTAIYFAATPIGSQLALRINQLKAVTTKDAAILPGTPKEIADLASNQRKGQALLHDVQGRWNDAIDRISLAVRFWQRKREMAELLPKVGVKLVGLYYDDEGKEQGQEEAIRLKEPITLRDKSNPNTDAHTDCKPMTLNKFFLLNVAVAAKTGGTVNALLKTVERKPKTPGGATQTVQSVRVVNPAMLGDTLSTAYEYLDGSETYNVIMQAIAKPNGGMLASRICYLYDTMTPYANNPSVRKLAEAYDAAQVDARAAEQEAKQSTGDKADAKAAA